MGLFFKKEEIKASKIKRIPFLPRVGIVVEFGNKRFAYKYVPVMETILNLIDGPITLSRFKTVMRNQFGELQFPTFKEKTVYDTTAKSHVPAQKIN